ncbi:MAG: hypothetical protein ACRD0K_04230 [Egibacteraceae bacterium]
MADYALQSGPRLVEAWAATRLAFEPKGWQTAFRRDLQAAARQLRVRSSELLYAVYASADQRLCDAENVLFYNVGLDAFARAMRHGIRFERSFWLPVNSDVLDAAHYHRYEPAAPESGFHWWRRGQLLQSWAATKWPITPTATGWWGAFVQSRAATKIHFAPPAVFGLEVVLSAPPTWKLPVHSIIKPLIDGVVAACHCHAGKDLQVVAERIAIVLAADAGQVADRLTSPAGTVLGPRRLLWPWADGVQWNPADDLCVAATIHARHDTNATQPAVTADVFVVEPVASSCPTLGIG